MLDRLEDKVVRRASKKVRLDPMIDEDSGDEEDYDSPPADDTKPFRASQAEQARRSRVPDVYPVDEDTEAVSALAITGRKLSVTTAPPPVGSALRKGANGSVAVPKVLPKRNKDSKVKEASS